MREREKERKREREREKVRAVGQIKENEKGGEEIKGMRKEKE